MTLFNTETIGIALNDSGLLVSELAYRVDIAINTLERILRGEPDPGEIRVATLMRIADNLGLPVQALFVAPPGPPQTETADATVEDVDVVADARCVIATIYDRGTTDPIRTPELAEALGWDLDRLRTAYDEADHRLRPAGLRLVREHGEVTVRPVHDHTTSRTRLTEVRAAERGFNAAHYTVAYQAHLGQPITYGNTGARRRMLGATLVNLGILTDMSNQPALSEEARFAHPD